MRHIKLIVALTITLFIAQIFVARAAMPIDAPAENPKILILHYSDIWQHFIKKAKENVSDLLEVSFYNYRMGNFPIPADIDFCAYDVILINEPTVGMEGFRQSIELAKRHARVIVISPGVLEGNVDIAEHPWIQKYWSNQSVENFQRLMIYLGVKFCGLKTEVKKPILFANKAIYHPDADHLFSDLKDYLRWYSKPDKGHHKYDPTKPTLGILFYKCTYLKGDLKAVDALLKEIEQRGCNVVATYGATGGFFGIKEFFMQENKSIVDVVISLVLYSMSQEEIKAFHTLDVPIILGKTLYYDGNMSPDEWKKDPRGMPPNSVSSVSLSETLGIIEPTVIAVAPVDPDTGKKRYEPINSQIEFIVNRALGYARLRHKANSDKKIVIMYYNDGCGKANLGTEMEFYLDAQASIVNLLRAMKDAGYNLGDKPIPSTDELSKIMAEQGSNVGVWAQGELKKRVKDGSVILIPEKKYLEWFNELPEDKRREAIDKWGEPPGKVMVYEEKGKKYIAIPKIQFGNVLLTPYPTRGWLQDKSVLSHEGAIPPYHQFIADFMWFKRGFGADAIVSVWTAFEGLKGKQTGLSKYGWKGLLIKDMLNIRPFSVHYIGCQTGKRRGGFLVIDHLSPPLVAAGSYKDISDLRQDISLYKPTLQGLLKEKYRKKIIKKCETLNINKALGTELDEIKTDSETFAEFLHQLESYLREMEREYMPYGLHVLGEVPQGGVLVSMVESMLGKEYKDHIVKINPSQGLGERLITEVIVTKVNVKGAQNKILSQVSEDITKDLNLAIEYANRINQCKIEIPRILAALDGRYIPPGPSGDIIRRPEVLPTGRNPYAFDDRIIPTKEAWDIGRQQAEQLIEKHRNKYNAYPEKIGFVLWISETNRHHGVMESEILYLLGVKPVWNRFERVGDVELIPATQLKRPRIDVVVTTSGSYRDGLSSKIKLIDKAVRLAAQAEKEKYENYIKVHSEENYKWLKENTNYRDSEAKDLSMARVFSHEIGRFNSGVGEMITAGNTWKNENQVADRYIGTMGFVYGGKLWGKQSKGIFKRNLKGMKIGVFSTSSDVVGVGDQGVPHYLGALGLAAKSVSGESADLYITNLRDSEDTKTETLDRFFNRELRSRYFNPKWIEGMMKHGYAGARNMEEFSEKLWHWDVTANELVTEDMWNEVNDIYVNDKYDLKLREYFDKNNPYALQSMISTMLEAREKGYWHPTKEVLEKLAKVYAEFIAKHGVACSYGTCAEPSLHKDVSKLLSAMPDVKPELIKKYQENVDKATVKLEEVKGYEMKEVDAKKEEKSATPKVALAAIVIVLLIMVVVGRGLWKGMRGH